MRVGRQREGAKNVDPQGRPKKGQRKASERSRRHGSPRAGQPRPGARGQGCPGWALEARTRAVCHLSLSAVEPSRGGGEGCAPRLEKPAAGRGSRAKSSSTSVSHYLRGHQSEWCERQVCVCAPVRHCTVLYWTALLYRTVCVVSEQFVYVLLSAVPLIPASQRAMTTRRD